MCVGSRARAVGDAVSKVMLTRCDGCLKYSNEVDIVKSKPRYRFLDDDDETIDMCVECEGEDLYCCQHCGRVHGDERPCEIVRAMMETAK